MNKCGARCEASMKQRSARGRQREAEGGGEESTKQVGSKHRGV